MPLIGALVVKEFQTWLRGRLTFAAFTLLVLLIALLVFLLGILILAPDANAAPVLFSTTSTTASNPLVAYRAMFLFGAVALWVIPAAVAVGPTAVVFSGLLLAVGAPFFVPAWSVGGVQGDQVIATVAVVCTVPLLFCAMGV